MANCVQCGISIPDGQTSCSMCYGDPDHGTDGHYRRWLEELAKQDEEKQRAQERWEREREEADA